MTTPTLKALDLAATLMGVALAAQQNALRITQLINAAATQERQLTEEELLEAEQLAERGMSLLDAAIARASAGG